MLVVILVGILSVILGGGDTPKICHEILSSPQLLCLEDCDDHLQYATDFEFSRLNRWDFFVETSWWFQTFFGIFTPIFGEMIQFELIHIFQMG